VAASKCASPSAIDTRKSRKIDVVVVSKVDRLSRSLLDFAKGDGAVQRLGCLLRLRNPDFSTADAMGRLTLNMLMSFAEFERSMLGAHARQDCRLASRWRSSSSPRWEGSRPRGGGFLLCCGAMRKPSRGRRPARAASARDALVRSALRAFESNSFDTVSVAELARRAKVSQPLLTYYFPTREDLWRAAVTEAFRALEASQASATELAEGLACRAQLELMLRRFVAFSAETPALAAVIVSESLKGGPRLTWLVKTHLAPLHRALDALLEAGVARGEFRALPPASVTQAMLGAAALFLTARPLVRQLYGVDSGAAPVVEQHAQTMVTLLLDGLAARAAS
jgi:TetR/AcrR family transcriptional regulator